MAKYICSSSEMKSEHARHWLEQNLLPDTKQFLVQSGYFSYAAIEPFIATLKHMAKVGSSIKLVLGSNGGSLAIKDTKAILKTIKGKSNCSLTVIALGNAEFHPKCYVITRNDGSRTALVGSQNLTFYGISKNFEAGIILDTYDDDDSNILDKIGNSIEKWLTAKEGDGAYQIYTMKDLYDLKQSKIIDQGNIEARIPSRKVTQGKGKPKKLIKKNVRNLWSQGRKPKSKYVKGKMVVNSAVLIAEIPKGSSRWKQANFDKDSFQSYFGLTIGKTQYVTLQHVSSTGQLSAKEHRPGVSVKSRNFRIELAAAKGLPYPIGTPPIGVFIRDTSTDFRYCLLMPNDHGHSIMAKYLTTQLGNPINRMRRKTTDYMTLKKIWAATPL